MKDLHAAIMNLPCDAGMLNLDHHAAYKMGHRDARHAAAELALDVVPAPHAQELSDAELEVLWENTMLVIPFARAVLAARGAR